MTNEPRFVVANATRPLIVSLLLAFNAACGDPLPITHETEHLRIGWGLERPLCAGDLKYYEGLIAKTQSDLKIDVDSDIEVYVWSGEWEEEGEQYCNSPHPLGCYHHNSRTIFTSEHSLPHEIVHAVVGQPKLQYFFSEGIAEVYAGRQTRFAISVPSSNEDSTAETPDSLTAAHFVHWLRHKWGGERLGDLIRLKSAAFDEFESVYGMSLEAAEQLYFEEAPAAFPALHSCDAPSLAFTVETQTWNAVVDLDCGSDSETRANHRGLFATRTFTIENAGPYHLYANHGWIQASLCIDSPVEELPNALEEVLVEDVPFAHASYPGGASAYFTGGVFHPVDLRAGLYVIQIGLDNYEPGSLQVAIWPREGEHPAEAM